MQQYLKKQGYECDRVRGTLPEVVGRKRKETNYNIKKIFKTTFKRNTDQESAYFVKCQTQAGVLQGSGPQGKLGPHSAIPAEMQGYSAYPQTEAVKTGPRSAGQIPEAP